MDISRQTLVGLNANHYVTEYELQVSNNSINNIVLFSYSISLISLYEPHLMLCSAHRTLHCVRSALHQQCLANDTPQAHDVVVATLHAPHEQRCGK